MWQLLGLIQSDRFWLQCMLPNPILLATIVWPIVMAQTWFCQINNQAQVQYINYTPDLAHVCWLKSGSWIQTSSISCPNSGHHTWTRPHMMLSAIWDDTWPGCEQLSTSSAWKLFTPFSWLALEFLFGSLMLYVYSGGGGKVHKTRDIKNTTKTKHKAIYMAWWIEDFKWEMARC